jgi:hypothetical protein
MKIDLTLAKNTKPVPEVGASRVVLGVAQDGRFDRVRWTGYEWVRCADRTPFPVKYWADVAKEIGGGG